MICEHAGPETDFLAAEMLRLVDEEVQSVIQSMAARGGGPGTGCVVLTDLQNVAWFYPAGHDVVAHTRQRLQLQPPAFPVQLGRELGEVLWRVEAECAPCAGRLRATPPGQVAVYARIGPTGEPLVASVPFPEELDALRRTAPLRGTGTTLLINGAEALRLARRLS